MAIPESLRTAPVFLIGFSGSGKSSVGERLANRLKVPFTDTDAEIAGLQGKSPQAIIEGDGLPRFRKLESEVIKEICKRTDPGVFSLGGGAFESASNRQLLLGTGTVVYLRCAVDELVRRLKDDTERPLLKAREKWERTTVSALRTRIQTLLRQRKANYEMAHVTVSTTRGTLQDQVSAIIEAVRRHHA